MKNIFENDVDNISTIIDDESHDIYGLDKIRKGRRWDEQIRDKACLL